MLEEQRQSFVRGEEPYLRIIHPFGVQLLNQILVSGRDIFGIGVTEHSVDMSQTIASRLRGIAYSLQTDQLGDQRSDRCLVERIARRDVSLLHRVGQTVYDGQQQTLVAQDDGCAVSGGNTVFLREPPTDITGLTVLCGSGDECGAPWRNVFSILVE